MTNCILHTRDDSDDSDNKRHVNKATNRGRRAGEPLPNLRLRNSEYNNASRVAAGTAVIVKEMNTRSSRVCGLADLPDEVLAIIFEFIRDGCTSRTPWREMYVLSRVCGRFRNIIVDKSQLWSDIRGPEVFMDCSHGEQYTKLCLERSKSALLDVRIGTLSNLETYERFDMELLDIRDYSYQLLRHLVPHSHRWRALTIEQIGRYGQLGEEDDECGCPDKCQHADFHELWKTADVSRLECLGVYQQPLAYPLGKTSKCHFYSLWQLPALRSLAALNFIPLENAFPTLTTLHAEFHSTDVDYEWNFGLLGRFLGSCPLLNEVKLAFNILGISEESSLVAELPNVRHLELVFCLVHDAETIKYFFDALDVPNLTSLKVALPIDYRCLNGSVVAVEDDNILPRDFVNILFPSAGDIAYKFA